MGRMQEKYSFEAHSYQMFWGACPPPSGWILIGAHIRDRSLLTWVGGLEFQGGLHKKWTP